MYFHASVGFIRNSKDLKIIRKKIFLFRNTGYGVRVKWAELK